MILKNGKRLDGCSDTVPIGTLNPYMGSVAPYGYLICEGQLVSKTTYKELYEICGDTFGTGTTTEFRLPDLRGKTIVGYKEGDSTFGTLGGLLGSLTHTHDFAHTHGVPGVKHTHSIGHTHGVPGVAHTHSLSGNGWADIILHSAGTIRYRERTTPAYKANYVIGGLSGAKYEDFSETWGAELGGTTDSATPSATTTNSQSTSTSGETTPASTTTNSQSKSTTDNASNLQPSVTMNWIVKAFLLMPNQSYVENSLISSSEINSLSAAKGKELNDKFNNYVSLHGENNMDGNIVFKSTAYSSIHIQNDNPNHESSILFTHTDFNDNDNKKAYVFGYGTGAYDGMGIWSWESSKNIATINKDGDLEVSGKITSSNIKVANSGSWAALQAYANGQYTRLQANADGRPGFYTSEDGINWLYYALFCSKTLKSKTISVTPDASGNAATGMTCSSALVVGVMPNCNKATYMYRYNNYYYLRVLADYDSGFKTFNATVYYFDL